jgi:hypothetical protein
VKHKALIKLGQVVDLNVLQNLSTIREGRELFAPGALRLVPNAPVLVDHDHARRVGTIVELVDMDDSDGRWLCARCVIDDAPAWLRGGSRVGSAASFGGLRVTDAQPMPGGWTRVNRAIMTEVSVLAPATKPFEPRARVVLLERTSSSAARGFSPSDRAPAAAGEIIPIPQGHVRRRNTELDEFHRRLDAAGPNADFELILEAYRNELGYPSSVRWAGVR